ncbi:enteropeptidase isoform X2 [Oncorhynchus keta]|uniref:enteropeptidase isoform X2 n=1 Tax=Oncorhynchus keta TaxID=8018 RepID=UPI0015FDC690|nr:enteropeptidase isoform X2 [Oncorhynchus keta]
MWRGKRRWSSTEVLLSVLCLTLLAVCVSLIIITWLAMQTDLDQCGLGGTESVFSGRLVITRGAVFTEKLRNRSSLQFKSLAFDTEHLISDAYGRGSLNNDFKACEVLEFSNGSVVVNFDLQFRQSVEVKEAEQQLVAGLQSTGGLVVNQNSIQVRVKEDLTTYQPTSSTKWTTTPHLSTTSSSGKCPPYHMACGDGTTCVATMQFCDGVDNCPDGSDENHTLCATKCDGQFLLLGPTGSFHSENFPLPYNNGMICRWVIRVQKGLAIKMNFHSFDTEEEIDTLSLYEGTGQGKNLTYLLSGRSPGTVWLLSDKATVEFSSDDYNNFHGFNATYSAEDISNLSNEERLSCSFEEGLCFWRQEPEDEGDWIRTNTPTFPPFTGPNFDHTFGNQSGYYIVTPGSPGQWEKNFKIRSLRLAHSKEPMCLKFWYHMYGENVHRLRVLVERRSTSLVREALVIVVFQKEGNYGDNWNFGQVTLNSPADATVVFEAQKKGGMKNDIALDDISLTNGPCGADPPDPTVVPTPTTPPPIPSDCGGPFDLWEPNSTFSSPNYPHSYGNKASCLWTLHAREGWNILLHFLDFDVESTYDMVEVRDGAGPQSELLGVFTGTDATFPDVISTANQITVLFFTDSTGYGRGFRANFTSGLALGMPKPCVTGQYRCQSGECISNASVCNGQPDCADSSDEADCVHQVSVDRTSVRHLQLQVQTTRYTTCGQHWNSQLSHFMCRYLGYRSGSALLIPSTEKDSPFTTVSVAANGTLDLTPSEKCTGEKVISLECDNQPCGVRMVSQKMDRSGSTERRREEKGEEESEEGGTVRVVGGTDSRKGAWPWMVSLYFRGRHVCGATLIDNEWLVTAAHCVYGKNIHLSNWEAVLGLHSQDSVDVLPSQTRKVDHIIMNKHYNRRTKDADIAMMHLQTNVNFTDNIQPICLPGSDQQFEAGMKCFITGWGAEVEQGTSANVLQQAVLPLVSRSECQKLLPEYNITARMVCAGYSEGGVDSCQGDSGGPLMCEEDGHWVQVGVISFGVGCGRPQRPGVYALVSQFTDWVVQTRRLS